HSHVPSLSLHDALPIFFPDGGYVGLTDDPVEWAHHLILPWFCLSILFIGFYGRVLRSNMLDVMNEDYVRTARAKGLAPKRVLLRSEEHTSELQSRVDLV